MNKLLTKLKLVDYHEFTLPVDKNHLVNKLKANVDRGSTSNFLSGLEMFSSSKNEYKGEVLADSFHLRKRPKMFDMNSMTSAKAKGILNEVANGTQVNLEINGFTGQFKPFLILVPIIYIIFIIAFLSSDTFPAFGLVFILVHGVFMLGMPYMFMRRSISRLKYDIERDMYYMVRNDLSTSTNKIQA
jgi:hypothetical protein